MTNGNPDDDTLRFEYTSLAERVMHDIRSGYVIISIMIPLSVGILGAFIINFDKFNDLTEIQLLIIVVLGGLASILPVLFAILIHNKYANINLRRFARMVDIESHFNIFNHRLYSDDCRKYFETSESVETPNKIYKHDLDEYEKKTLERLKKTLRLIKKERTIYGYKIKRISTYFYLYIILLIIIWVVFGLWIFWVSF